jgi:hypothetical protein
LGLTYVIRRQIAKPESTEILYRIALDDSVHWALVAVTLRQSELATQIEIAAAFGHSVATQRRWETRYAQHGSDGLHANSPSTKRFFVW